MMTPEQQRIAIAESVGWKDIYDEGVFVDFMWAPGHINKAQAHYQRGTDYTIELPDYLNDLNAMHEVEKTLDNKFNLIGEKGFQTERDLFIETLERIIDPLCAEEDIYWFTIHATAAQRAEAYLRTKGLWKE